MEFYWLSSNKLPSLAQNLTTVSDYSQRKNDYFLYGVTLCRDNHILGKDRHPTIDG